MMGLLRRANQRCEVARQEEQSALTARQIRWIGRHYEAILAQADADNPKAIRRNKRRGRVKQSLAFNLISRLREHADAVLRFVADLRVPFTNNWAHAASGMSPIMPTPRLCRVPGMDRQLSGGSLFLVI